MENNAENNKIFTYELKKSVISNQEMQFFNCIKSVVPSGYNVIPQANLASFINKTDGSKFHNELFRNVDFLITDSNFKPYIVIEINDLTHNKYDRKKRDEKVSNICKEAGIDIITLWTTYGVNSEYIKSRIDTALADYPPERVCCNSNNLKAEMSYKPAQETETKVKTDDKSSKRFAIGAYIGSLFSLIVVLAFIIAGKPYIDSSLFTKTRIFSIIGIGLSVCHIVESKDVKRTIIPLICGAAALLLTFIVF